MRLMSDESTYPNSGLCQVGPRGDFLSCRHIWVPIPGERRLQLLELLAREVGSLSSLALFLFVFLGTTVFWFCFGIFTRICKITTEMSIRDAANMWFSGLISFWLLKYWNKNAPKLNPVKGTYDVSFASIFDR